MVVMGAQSCFQYFKNLVENNAFIYEKVIQADKHGVSLLLTGIISTASHQLLISCAH